MIVPQCSTFLNYMMHVLLGYIRRPACVIHWGCSSYFSPWGASFGQWLCTSLQEVPVRL